MYWSSLWLQRRSLYRCSQMSTVIPRQSLHFPNDRLGNRNRCYALHSHWFSNWPFLHYDERQDVVFARRFFSVSCFVSRIPPNTWSSGILVILVANKMALAMLRLVVSPIPMGQTPGFLSRKISRQAKKEAILAGSTRLVQNLYAVWARD